MAVKKRVSKARKKPMFNAGDEIEVVGNSSGHALPVGSRATIRLVDARNQRIHVNECPSYLFFYDAKLVEENGEMILKTLEEKELEKDLVADKIAYLDQAGTETLDDVGFKDYQLRKVLSSDELSVDDKISKLNSLFNGGYGRVV